MAACGLTSGEGKGRNGKERERNGMEWKGSDEIKAEKQLLSCRGCRRRWSERWRFGGNEVVTSLTKSSGGFFSRI